MTWVVVSPFGFPITALIPSFSLIQIVRRLSDSNSLGSRCPERINSSVSSHGKQHTENYVALFILKVKITRKNNIACEGVILTKTFQKSLTLYL